MHTRRLTIPDSNMNQPQGNKMNKIIVGLFGGLASIIALTVLSGCWFTVSEGHEGVVTRWSKARYSVGSGLNFKAPLIDGVVHLEMREIANKETMQAATKDQLPATVIISTNWQINKGTAFEFFQHYGTRERFEAMILDRKLQNAVKAALPNFTADELIQNRQKAAMLIDQVMDEAMKDYPVTITAAQIEDIQLPESYMKAVMAKEQARQESERERHILSRQNYSAQQQVQSAKAQAEATLLQAEADAKAIELNGRANALAAELMAKAIAANPALVQYEYAKKWNGTMPHMVPPGNAPMLLQIPGR